MSYILDALKKAERERGIAKVPTLATMHDFEATPRIRPWMVFGASILSVAAVLWFLIPFSRKDAVVAPPRTDGSNRIATRQNALSMEESAPLIAPSFSSQQAESPRARKSLPSRDVPTRDAKTGAGLAAVSPGERVIGAPGIAAPKPAPGERPTNLTPRALVPMTPDVDDLLADEEEEAPVPVPAAAQAKPTSLREAIRGLKMSIHMFSENKAERLVFINGRKYVEGDLVEEKYLLESIAPEGAVLTYKEERATLRPGAK